MTHFTPSNYSKKVRAAVEAEGYGWDESWEVRDGTDRGFIHVTRENIATAVPRDPCKCPIAQAVKKQGLQPVIMKTTSLIGDPETKIIWRYDMNNGTRRFVEAIDQGETVSAIQIVLKPHGPSDRLDVQRVRTREHWEKRKEPGYTPRPQKRSPVSVRNLSKGAL